jgi:phosphoribosylformimino-5-aminoimidazole carboxamide ribotide isomerase
VARSPLLIPAVDVLGDEAVRLEQGDFARVTHRAGDPLDLVRRFAAAGAPLVHLVDLEGARSGVTRPAVVRVAASVVGVQAAGGVRSVADARVLVEAGATRVVIGTAAFVPGALDEFVDALGKRLVVAVDVRDGAVAVEGWTDTAKLGLDEAVDLCARARVPRLLCTAVERDGTLGGPDLRLLERVHKRFGGPVLAAGGISGPADLDALGELGIEGAVAGRALLDGRLPLSTLAA